MEKVPKLWQNVTYINWKASTPGQEVGLVLTLVTTNCKEFEHQRMAVDISDETYIKYPALNLNDDEVEGNGEYGDGNSQDMIADSEGEDDSDDDDDDDDDDIQQSALEVTNKADDSGFCSGAEDGSRIEALMGIGTQWTATPPKYHLGLSASSSSFQGSSFRLSTGGTATRTSFDHSVQRTPQTSSIGELMGGQALIKDRTMPEELEELWKLANEQIDIAHHFDRKFS